MGRTKESYVLAYLLGGKGNKAMETFVDNQLKISVRNLVEFIYRSGDLDNRRTGKKDKEAMQEGSRIHRKIQGRMGSSYHAEVPLKIDFNYDDFVITVEGRADGIIEEEEITIDEIKGVYMHLEHINEPFMVHKAQAMCYGYIYGILHELDHIQIQMTYCNMETEEILRFKERYEFQELADWFEDLIGQYYKWAKYLFDSKQIRNKSIKKLEFPFPYRDGQRDLVVSVYKTVRQKRDLFIQAPTGIGKTMSTVFPAVKAVGEELGDKIFYLTAKTITRTVACESFNILREEGLEFKSVVITAKDKICAMEETECNPVYCPRAKGHYDRINDAIFDVITNESDITREVITKYAHKHQVCPFELCLDITNWVDGIICDYNYVFDPTVKLKRYFSEGIKGEHIFLVDESHNLVDRAREMYSAGLYKEQFEQIREIMEFRHKGIHNAVKKCETDLLHYKRECEDYHIIEDVNDFVLHLMRVSALLEQYLEEEQEFDGREELLLFYFDVCNFLNIYEIVDEYYKIYCILEDTGRFLLKLYCVNPSRNLKSCMEKGNSTVFFSATLLPVMYYKELLSGNKEDYAVYVNSPFDDKKRFLFAADDVSSKFTRRNIAEFQKISRYIKSIYESKKGNYMIFFPSYKLMESVYDVLTVDIGDDVEVVMQTSKMDEIDREEFLGQFTEDREKSLIAFCVLGGLFSEGIDLVNDKLIGSIVVGTGLPQICAEREILKNYFDESGHNGFDYAYRYPGMNKVMQAAGRVIRTTEDTGVIGLLDERFLQRGYQGLFPREWKDCKRLNVSTIDKDIGEFWSSFGEKIKNTKKM